MTSRNKKKKKRLNGIRGCREKKKKLPKVTVGGVVPMRGCKGNELVGKV